MRDAEEAVEDIRGKTESEAREARAEAERQADSITQRRLDEIQVLRRGLLDQSEAIAQGFNQLTSALAAAADSLARAAGERPAPEPPPWRRVRLTVSERREISVTLEHEHAGEPTGEQYIAAAGRPIEATHPPESLASPGSASEADPEAPPPPHTPAAEKGEPKPEGEPEGKPETRWRRVVGPLLGRWRRG